MAKPGLYVGDRDCMRACWPVRRPRRAAAAPETVSGAWTPAVVSWELEGRADRGTARPSRCSRASTSTSRPRARAAGIPLPGSASRTTRCSTASQVVGDRRRCRGDPETSTAVAAVYPVQTLSLGDPEPTGAFKPDLAFALTMTGADHRAEPARLHGPGDPRRDRRLRGRLRPPRSRRLLRTALPRHQRLRTSSATTTTTRRATSTWQPVPASRPVPRRLLRPRHACGGHRRRQRHGSRRRPGRHDRLLPRDRMPMAGRPTTCCSPRSNASTATVPTWST